MPVTIADENLSAFAFAALEETFDMMENDEQHEFVKRMRDICELKHWVREYVFSDIHNDVLQRAIMNSIVWNQLQLDFIEWAEAALDTSEEEMDDDDNDSVCFRVEHEYNDKECSNNCPYNPAALDTSA